MISPKNKEVKVQCYLVMESNNCCKGIRFKPPSGEYVGIEMRPRAIKLINSLSKEELKEG